MIDSRNFIFLLGISQRSGTNFLMKLLENHPEVIQSKHPGEDFIINNSHSLLQHINGVKSNWNSNWEKTYNEKYGKTYLDFLRNAILEYLKPEHFEPNQYCITKTPSVKNIDNTFKLFPNSKVIILLRNGKNIIESGIQGFKWNFEDAVQKHKNYTEIVLDFLTKNKNNPNIHVVKYENLIDHGEEELKMIFEKLGLKIESYDFTTIDKTPIFGSSFAKVDNEVSWQPVTKTASFNPNQRSKNWSIYKKLYYDFYCKKLDKQIGY